MEGEAGSRVAYALGLADDSYNWYKAAAIRSRRSHRISAILNQALAAIIPVSAAIAPQNALVPALLGATIVIVSGLRATFNWQENYVRFSGAREAVERERRLYHTGAFPYDDLATRDQILADQVTNIERDEMSSWFKIVSEHRPRQGRAKDDAPGGV